MKLFILPGACSLAPHIVMAELNMAYEIDVVSRVDKSCASGNFLDINPKGSVPALKMEDGEILTEGAIISQYLADQKNDGKLLAKFGTLQRVRTLEMMNFIATEIHKTFSPLFGAAHYFKAVETQTDVKNHYLSVMNDKLTFLSQKLGQNEFIMGSDFTIADAYLFTCLSWSKHVKVDLSKFTNITAYLERISQRPSVVRAMKEEGLL